MGDESDCIVFQPEPIRVRVRNDDKESFVQATPMNTLHSFSVCFYLLLLCPPNVPVAFMLEAFPRALVEIERVFCECEGVH